MLNRAVLLPLLSALDDSSDRVRAAAARAAAALLKACPGDPQLKAFSVHLPSIDAASIAAERHVIHDAQSQPVASGDDRSALSKPWGTPQEWRERFQTSDSTASRLHFAIYLATAGEGEPIETTLKEIERGSLDFANIRIADECTYVFPNPVVNSLRRLAAQATRRGDVRQIAFLLSERYAGFSESANWRSRQPRCLDLEEHARALADRYLGGNSVDFGADDAMALSFLEAEYAALFVAVLFRRCAELASDRALYDLPYMVGNSLAGLIQAWGDRFVPDIPALFETYRQLHKSAGQWRRQWYDERDDYVLFFSGTGHLALSWQLAWTVSRAPIERILLDLDPFLSDAAEQERLAAAELLEDALRFTGRKDAPQFGGGSGPPDVIPAPTREQSAPNADYDVVDVFYGTDRALSGSLLPSKFYGSAESTLSLGTCKVSIPKARQHEIGEVEKPSWLKLEFREDPSKHVVLLTIKAQPESDFVSSLRASTQAAAGRQVLFFVHGYRVSFEDAARRTAQLAHDLDIGVPVFYSWPSRGTFFGYGTDIRSAEASVPNLLRFLRLVAAESGAATIHLIAHSMGNLALTKALQDFPDPSRKEEPFVREVILAAPDIDAKIFREQIAPRILRPLNGPRFTLYTSHNDYALWCARILRSGYVRAGDYENGRPVVVPGIQTIDVSAVNTSFLGWLTSHSYVGDRPPVLKDIFDVFKGTPPDMRFGMKRLADLAGTPYWVFRPHSS